MVKVSREFICVRPQTYEDKSEAEVMLSLFRGRSGGLENTVFCVLAPDGKTQLTRAGRSPMRLFDDDKAFASFLAKTSKRYQQAAQDIHALPVLDELPLAVNVASCDQIPLVVLKAKSKQQLKALTKKVAKLAWSKEFVGRQHFVTVLEASQAPPTSHPKKRGETVAMTLKLKLGVTVVQPDTYGLDASTLSHAPPSASHSTLVKTLRKAHKSHRAPAKSRRSHMRTARRQGITWDSELDVSDPQERRGRRRR